MAINFNKQFNWKTQTSGVGRYIPTLIRTFSSKNFFFSGTFFAEYDGGDWIRSSCVRWYAASQATKDLIVNCNLVKKGLTFQKLSPYERRENPWEPGVPHCATNVYVIWIIISNFRRFGPLPIRGGGGGWNLQPEKLSANSHDRHDTALSKQFYE